MFREMRRQDRVLAPAAAEEILRECTHGTLSVIGDMGYPYGVPVSFAYADGKIYLHCAPKGHKLDALRTEPKVSFSVVAMDDVMPEKYGTGYRSVIVFGKARIIDDADEIRSVHLPIIEKYSKDYYEGGIKYMNASIGKMVMIEIEIEHMTGKGNA